VGALAAFNLAVKEKSLSETYDHLRECQRRVASGHTLALVF